MSVEGFSPVIARSTPMLDSVSDWGTRLVAPLGALMSIGLVIAAVIGAREVAREYGYLTGRATPTHSSSTGYERNQLQMKHQDLLNRIDLWVKSPENKGFFAMFSEFTRLERQLIRLIQQEHRETKDIILGRGASPDEITQQRRLQKHDILLQIDQQSK